jgi:hypothetical protein
MSTAISFLDSRLGQYRWVLMHEANTIFLLARGLVRKPSICNDMDANNRKNCGYRSFSSFGTFIFSQWATYSLDIQNKQAISLLR